MVFEVCSTGQAQQSVQVLHNHVPAAVSSRNAALVGLMPEEQQIHVSIVMPLRNENELTKLLSRLYDPSSPDYHHFLSVEQFTEGFGPTVDDYQAVVSFAQAHGLTVTDTPRNRLVVPITGSVGQINKALNMTMEVYRHPTDGVKLGIFMKITETHILCDVVEIPYRVVVDPSEMENDRSEFYGRVGFHPRHERRGYARTGPGAKDRRLQPRSAAKPRLGRGSPDGSKGACGWVTCQGWLKIRDGGFEAMTRMLAECG